jgi:hypothetical protein
LGCVLRLVPEVSGAWRRVLVRVAEFGGLDAAYQMLDDRAQELDDRAERRKRLQQQLDTPAQRTRDLDAQWTETSRCSGQPGNELLATVNHQRDALTDSMGLLDIRDVSLQPAASLSNPAQLVDIVKRGYCAW